jgi:hypothetical protein
VDAGRPRSRDVVGTFLKSVKGARPSSGERWNPPISIESSESPSSDDAPSDSDSPASAAAAAPSESPSVVGVVLRQLSERDHVPIGELASDLRMPILEAAGVLTKLASTGLIQIHGEPGDELVVLTDSGRTIAPLS